MLQNLSTIVRTNELKDVEVSFTKSIQTSEKGSSFLILDNDNYNICLFQIKGAAANGKKSFIRFNARVHFKHSGILFYMPVKELANDQVLIAGQAAKAPGFRAVVTEYSPERGMAYERMAIPESQYYELMAIIRAGTAA